MVSTNLTLPFLTGKERQPAGEIKAAKAPVKGKAMKRAEGSSRKDLAITMMGKIKVMFTALGEATKQPP